MIWFHCWKNHYYITFLNYWSSLQWCNWLKIGAEICSHLRKPIHYQPTDYLRAWQFQSKWAVGDQCTKLFCLKPYISRLLKSLCSSLQKNKFPGVFTVSYDISKHECHVPPPVDWLRHLGLCGALRYLLEKKLINFLLTIFCIPSPWWHFQLQHNVAIIPCGEIYTNRHHGIFYFTHKKGLVLKLH